MTAASQTDRTLRADIRFPAACGLCSYLFYAFYLEADEKEMREDRMTRTESSVGIQLSPT